MDETSKINEWVSLFNNFSEDSLANEGWSKFVSVNETDAQLKVWRQLENGNSVWLIWGCLAGIDAETAAAILRDYVYRKKFMVYTSCIEPLEQKELPDGFCDTIYWRLRIPLMPWTSEREYLYNSRRWIVDGLFVQHEKSIDEHEKAPANPKYVRVDYNVVYMLKSITKNNRVHTLALCKCLSAMDFKIPLPTLVLNWFASIGVNHYLSVARKSVVEYKEIKKEKVNETKE